jgi:feruloyl esterase
MIGTFAVMFLGAAVAATPCDQLTTVKFNDATITSAVVVPEGPAPGRGGGGGGGGARGGNRGGNRGGGQAQPGGARGFAPQQQTTPVARGGIVTPQTIPAHCRVQMTLKPTSDSNIMMELWLPTTGWNGKFMGVGNGGFAGSIQGLGSEMPQALRLGYGTWAIGHPEKLMDFAYRSTHEMTLKAKELIKAFYDKAAQFAYFKGCSTGGRMAVMEAQRYPDDYDGIIAGSLANRHIHMWTAGFARGIDLLNHPEKALTTEKAALVNQMVAACDTLKEGFLNNPRQCQPDFKKLLCPTGKDDATCLTAPQLQTVETFYGGLKNSKGELIFSGQALGNPIGAQRGQAPGAGGTFDIVRIAFNDPNFDWRKFDLDRDMKFIDEQIGYVDAVNPDLGKFKSSGGKLLLTHGWADTGITPETTIWYYESVLEKMGRSQSDWLRLFMAPGMGHCGGGSGVNTFDSIGALEKWVEKGIAPDEMLGINTAQNLTRPLCPYPQYADYKGSGDIKDAKNWMCKAPSR